MLRTRVIPVVLIDGYSVLKTITFEQRRNQGNPIVVARTYNTRNVDELILLDIDASKNNRSIDLATIREVTGECFMPLTVGGGIRTLDDINAALRAGADKVVLNTAIFDNPNFVKEAVRVFGAQCIIGSIDVKNGEVYSHSGRAVTIKDPVEFACYLEKLGVGEIFLNSVDHDGVMTGADLALIESFRHQLSTPLIYCGGIGKPADCVSAVNAGANAIAAASIFHFTRYVPDDCKKEMKKNGIPVRLDLPVF